MIELESKEKQERDVLLAEYNALKGEKSSLRQGLATTCLILYVGSGTAAGVILSSAYQAGVLVLPFLQLGFLGAYAFQLHYWEQLRIYMVSLESRINYATSRQPILGWETATATTGQASKVTLNATYFLVLLPILMIIALEVGVGWNALGKEPLLASRFQAAAVIYGFALGICLVATAWVFRKKLRSVA